MTISLIPTTEELSCYQVMAKNANSSKFVNGLGGDAGILAIMLMAREIGIPPMTAIMGGIWNIQGKIELSARLMNSMIRKAGHKIEIKECADTKCVLKGVRKETGEFCEVSLTIEEAKKAGMYKAGGVWDKFPSDMLFARCLSRLARRLFPDIIGTAYVEGEISGEKEDSSPVVKDKEVVTVDVSSIEEEKPKPEIITKQQFSQIMEEIGNDPAYVTRLAKFFRDKNLCEAGLHDLHAVAFPGLMKGIQDRKQVSIAQAKVHVTKDQAEEEELF